MKKGKDVIITLILKVMHRDKEGIKMDKEHIQLGMRGIEDLQQRRDKLNNDIEIWMVRIKTMDKEISELTKILNKELIDLIEYME